MQVQQGTQVTCFGLDAKSPLRCQLGCHTDEHLFHALKVSRRQIYISCTVTKRRYQLEYERMLSIMTRSKADAGLSCAAIMTLSLISSQVRYALTTGVTRTCNFCSHSYDMHSCMCPAAHRLAGHGVQPPFWLAAPEPAPPPAVETLSTQSSLA